MFGNLPQHSATLMMDMHGGMQMDAESSASCASVPECPRSTLVLESEKPPSNWSMQQPVKLQVAQVAV